MWDEVIGLISCSNMIRPAKGFLRSIEQLSLKTFYKKSTPPCFFGLLHVTMGGILNKISEITFSVGCMVWP